MFQELATMIVGIIGGVSVGLQSPVVNAMSQRIGTAAGSFVIHVSGAFFSGLLLLARGGEQFREVRSLPIWMLASGLFGVVLFVTINHTIPRIGTAAAVGLIIVGQLVVGMIVDHFGLLGVTARPVELTRLIAALFLLVGGYLMVR